MGGQADDPSGPDFGDGVPAAAIPTAGALPGHVAGNAVLLCRVDDSFVAFSGTCTHYGAPLADGLIANGEVRCPWHHACFSLRTGEAVGAPAFAPLQRYRVEVVDDEVYVREGLDDSEAPKGSTAPSPRPLPAARGEGEVGSGAKIEKILIVGGGAAGFAAAERLRTLGYGGALTMLSDDSVAPCDRPNLSKDYLAGTAQADWMPLKGAEFYSEQRIDLRVGVKVSAIDRARRVVSSSAGEFPYDRLLLATGAEPMRLDTPGFDRANVFALRTQGDADAIVAALPGARSAVLIGAGFIGLEAAAALRHRGIAVHVVARDELPLAKVLGPELGRMLLELHRKNGVEFHLKRNATSYDGKRVTLDDGGVIDADLVVVGVGVKPRTGLAEQAGLAVDRGVSVDAMLATGDPNVYAAGDVARYPLRGEAVRIEHWVHAERMGQCAAGNLLGLKQAFRDVPFFWTQHYETSVRYVGYAGAWDEARVEGDVAGGDGTVRYFKSGKLRAAASVGRDLENLEIEAELRGVI